MSASVPSEVPAFLTELVQDLYDDADRDYLSELVGDRWLAYAANTDVGKHGIGWQALSGDSVVDHNVSWLSGGCNGARLQLVG